MKFLDELKTSHNFFVDKSPVYLYDDAYVKYSWKDKCYFPIAYCKFMCYSILHYLKRNGLLK